MTTKKKSWDTLSSDAVLQTRYCSVMHEKFITPAGGEGDYWLVRDPHGQRRQTVKIVVVTSERKMLLTREYRYPMAQFVVGIPGGFVDVGETPRAAAARELSEEVGGTCAELIDLGTCLPFPALVDEESHLFLAMDIVFGTAHPDVHEEEIVVDGLYDVATVYAKLDAGEIKDALAVTALTYARKHLIAQA